MSRHLALLLTVSLSACAEEPVLPAGLEQWLADWEHARACLLPKPGDPATQLAIAQLAGPPNCDVALAAIRIRGPRDVDATSTLWRDAIATARAVEPSDAPTPTAGAIARVDHLARLLRFAFGMQHPARKQGLQLRMLDAGQTLVIDDEAVTSDVALTLHGNAISGRFERGGQIIDFFGSTLDGVRSYPHARTDAVAYPSGKIVSNAIAALDRDDAQLVIRPPGRDSDAAYIFEATTRKGARRSVVGRADGSVVGILQWPGEVQLRVLLQNRDGMRVHTYNPDYRGNEIWRLVRGPAPSPIKSPEDINCQAELSAWAFSRRRVVSLTGSEYRTAVPRNDFDFDCGSAIVMLEHGPDRIETCDVSPEMGGCRVEHRAAHRRRGVVASDPLGTWIYAVQLEDVVGVWRGLMEPRFYRLPRSVRVSAVVVLENVPYVVALDDQRRYRFIEIPFDELRSTASAP